MQTFKLPLYSHWSTALQICHCYSWKLGFSCVLSDWEYCGYGDG